MSDNQKYYYLKLVDNFFDRDEMIMLESMPDGYLYSNILLKLYLRSLKNTGKLMFNDRIPYNPTMLANITRHPVAVVEKAVDIFQQLGLVEILDNGAIYMLDIQDFIGKSSTEADRKRNYRRRIDEEKKQLLEEKGQTVGQMSQQVSEINGQMSQQVSEINGQMSGQISTIIRDRDRDETQNSKSVGEFASLYEKNIGMINGLVSEWLIGISNEIDIKLFKRALEICTERGKTNLGYLKGIINNWTNKNITTYDQLQAYKLQQDKPKQQDESHKFDFLDRPKTSNDEELDEEALEMLRKLEEWGAN